MCFDSFKNRSVSYLYYSSLSQIIGIESCLVAVLLELKKLPVHHFATSLSSRT